MYCSEMNFIGVWLKPGASWSKLDSANFVFNIVLVSVFLHICLLQINSGLSSPAFKQLAKTCHIGLIIHNSTTAFWVS